MRPAIRPSRQISLRVILALFTLATLASLLYAAPFHPDVEERLREEPRWERIIAEIRDARAHGYDQPPAQIHGWLRNLRGRTDVERTAIVILVDFADNQADATEHPPSHYEDLLFSEGSHSTGSMRDWYLENSYDDFGVTGSVTQWYRMPQDYSYYVNGEGGGDWEDYPNNPQKMAEDAIAAADPDVDFSQFDNDGPDGIPNSGDDDGYVDALFIVHAGPGRETTGNDNDMHSHKWQTRTPQSVDGVLASTYSTEPEDGNIGVFCHEFGHVLGLPDLYDTDDDNGKSAGIGYWGTMASGSWLDGGVTPGHFCCWSKAKLGFLNPVEPVYDANDVEFPEVEVVPICWKLRAHAEGGNEYFLIENRRLRDFDAFLPGDGLVIYHVDENQSGNQDENHYMVAVEQADGFQHLEDDQRGDDGDPFPGSTGNFEFSRETGPNSEAYSGKPTGVVVRLKTGSQSSMIADLETPSVYVIRTDGSGFTDTIQETIDHDTAGDGELILLADGTFTGEGNREINFHGKDLTVRSENGDPTAVIIDCQNVTRGFRLKSGETEWATVEGLTIKNGWNPETGGGMSCYFESSPTIRNCIFLDNDAGEFGGGLAVGWSSHPTVEYCTFDNNGAPLSGAGIYCHWHSPITIRNTLITNGRTSEAFYCGALSIPDASCCNFYGNEGEDWRGNVEDLLGQSGNVSVDPLYCNAPDDLSLCEDSPCLFTSGDCAPQIGALGQGCDPCGPQVCCKEGLCYIFTSQGDCDAISGEWHPEWDVCDPNPCPQPVLHVCCTGEDCTLTEEDDCISGGGTWYDDLDTCNPNPCWQRACCVGEVCTITTEHDCAGDWYLSVDSCDPNPCVDPPSAVCCTSTGQCFLVTEDQCDVWYSGIWHSEWDTCDPNPCALMACCSDQVCTITIGSECEGIWHPNINTCDPNPCDLAACCIGDDCSVLTEQACNDAGGIWHSEWETCAGDPCKRAACCEGVLCTVTIESECIGTWNVDEPYCDPNPCPAVCCTQAVCTIAPEAECIAGGGVWYDIWDNCDSDPCPAVCCIGGTCELRTDEQCTGVGGSWHPAGSTCDPNPCTHVVRPDQQGDFATIQAAIDAAGPNEIIALTNGVFHVSTHQGTQTEGINFLGKSITVFSLSDRPDLCIIECDSTGRGFWFGTSEGSNSLLRGVTIRNGLASWGGGIYCSGASPTIENCVFDNNDAVLVGGGLYCVNSSAPFLSDCTFERNTAQLGGAVLSTAASWPQFFDCLFRDNTGIALGGAIHCANAGSPGGSEAIGCTFYGNEAPQGSAIYGEAGTTASFNKVLIAFNEGGPAVKCEDSLSAPSFWCSDIYGNLGGDWVGCIQDQLAPPENENIWEDPRFCDPPETLSLCLNSPCLPENNGCGLMGAIGQGCTWCYGSSDLADGALITHHPPDLRYSQGQDWCQRYADEFAITACPEQNNLILAHGDTAMVWYVLAAWNEEKQWCRAEFGLGSYDPSEFVIVDHGPCFPGEGETSSTDGWPDAGEGIILEITDVTWSGNFIPIYWFAGYTTGPAGIVPLDQHPVTGFAGTVDCGYPPFKADAACLGGIGFAMDGTYCCPPAPTTPAVCCIDGVCSILTESDCSAQYGTFYATWDSCDPNPCPAVCCIAGTCLIAMEDDCAIMGGIWFGEWDTCEPNPCPAVCCVDAVCSLVTQSQCLTLDGSWYSNWTVCNPDPCPAACCIGEACVFTSSGDCAGQGGTWYADEGTCAPNPCIPPRDWTNHDIGNCILTMTDQGTLGFLDNSQSEGSGFVFPADGENILYLGSCWLGVNSTYIANRDYDADPNREWTVASDPDGHVWIDENGTSMQDIHSAYTDSAATAPVGLFVDQESWAYTVNEATADFVIVRYTFKNLGASTLDDLYAGVFMDLDIGDWADDTGGAVDSLDLIYMTDESNIHAGASVLYDMGDPPRRNLTLIDNETFVWPNSYVLDADKWDFLTAADPSHILTEPDSLGDYSLLASAGPFSIAPGEERLVSFAILGGESLERLMQNAHVAQMVYSGNFTDAPEESDEPIRITSLRSCFPNPFRHETTVRYELNERSRVALSIYDVNGALVRRLADEMTDPGRHQIPWDGRTEGGRKAPAGVYFLKFVSKDVREGRRLILLK